MGRGRQGLKGEAVCFGLSETWSVDCVYPGGEGVDAYGTLSFHVEMDNKLRT